MTVWQYGAEDAEMLVQDGQPFSKRPNLVYMVQSPEVFEVQTNEGLLRGQAGDWIAHDPMSGHIWPVSDEYKQMHYLPAGEGEVEA